MLIAPRKYKYRKSFKIDTSGKGKVLQFRGSVSLIATEGFIIKANVLEALRKTFVKAIRESMSTGVPLIRIFPHTPITKKPAEVRMGSGKGGVDFYGCKIKKGDPIIDVIGVSDAEKVKIALAKLSYKLPGGSKCVSRLFFFS